MGVGEMETAGCDSPMISGRVSTRLWAGGGRRWGRVRGSRNEK